MIKKLLSSIISIIAVVVIVLAVLQFGISPKADNVKEKLESYDNDIKVAVESNASVAEPGAKLLFGVSNATATVIIADFRDGVLSTDAATIIYFDSYSDMWAARDVLKEKYKDNSDGIKVQFRGKSIIVGDKDVISLYREKVWF